MKKIFALLITILFIASCAKSGDVATLDEPTEAKTTITTVAATETSTIPTTTEAQDEYPEPFHNILVDRYRNTDFFNERLEKMLALIFLDCLMKNDYDTISKMMNSNSPEAYKFINDIKFDKCEIFEEYDKTNYYGIFKLKFNISKSNNKLFPKGETYWFLQIGVASSMITGLERCEKNSKADASFKEKEISDESYFCYLFSYCFDIYETSNDFNKTMVKSKYIPYHGIKKFYETTAFKDMGSYGGFYDYLDKLDKNEIGYPVKHLCDYIKKTTGITEFDFIEHDDWCYEYDPVKKTLTPEQGHGGGWSPYTVLSEKYDNNTGIYTTIIDYYSDTAYLVVAKTIKYTHKKDADGTNIMISTEVTYDSGYEIAYDCI